MALTEENARATTASVDRRIERLEDAVSHLQDSYNDLDRKIDRVELGQTHLKELLDARLSTHDTKIDSLNIKIDSLVTVKLDGLIDMIGKSQIEAARMMSDVNATPAGRAVTEEIKDLRVGREANAAKIAGLEKKLFFFSGGLAVLVFIANIIAPIIQSAIGISH